MDQKEMLAGEVLLRSGGDTRCFSELTTAVRAGPLSPRGPSKMGQIVSQKSLPQDNKEVFPHLGRVSHETSVPPPSRMLPEMWSRVTQAAYAIDPKSPRSGERVRGGRRSGWKDRSVEPRLEQGRGCGASRNMPFLSPCHHHGSATLFRSGPEPPAPSASVSWLLVPHDVCVPSLCKSFGLCSCQQPIAGFSETQVQT